MIDFRTGSCAITFDHFHIRQLLIAGLPNIDQPTVKTHLEFLGCSASTISIDL